MSAGISIGAAIELLERDVVRPGATTASGRHLAYIPGGGIYHAALGDFLAAVTNKYSGVFFTGPGPVRMENMVVRWVADLVGYPAAAAGSIASGGSIANLTAIVTARDSHRLAAAQYASAVVYLTEQAHHCLEKALRIAGMAETRLHRVEMDDGYRMRPEALARAIAADRAQGLRPWMIVAAAGTTDVGAVDPLDAIATVAERERCWLHVDAAYGGFFLLTEEGRAKLRGIERSDSVVLDPHKGLFLPYGSGVVVVRDGAALVASHDYFGSYMQDARAGAERGVAGGRVAGAVPAFPRPPDVAAARASRERGRSRRRWRKSCCSRAISGARSRPRDTRWGRSPTCRSSPTAGRRPARAWSGQ